MHLARLEMSVALNLLLDRLPNLRLDPDSDDPHIRGGIPVTNVAARPVRATIKLGPAVGVYSAGTPELARRRKPAGGPDTYMRLKMIS